MGGFGDSWHPQSSAMRVVLATLVLLSMAAMLSPAPGRADTGYPVLLVHGGIVSPADFGQMSGQFREDQGQGRPDPGRDRSL